MQFTKMEGLGNDYIYLNCMDGEPPDLPGLSIRLSDRHFGVGADGVICIKPGRRGDFSMEMYNADGSRGAMCGNGIRCLGKYVYEQRLTRKTCLAIDTDAGLRELELLLERGQVEQVTVDMGEATFSPEISVEVAGEAWSILPVSVGNPHAVILCDDPQQVELERLGPILEVHPALPQRSNVEFAALPDRETILLRVWERGSGITLACGTGACACFAAARRARLCGDRVTVHLPGGSLQLEQRGGRILMTGPARRVFEGVLEE